MGGPSGTTVELTTPHHTQVGANHSANLVLLTEYLPGLLFLGGDVNMFLLRC